MNNAIKEKTKTGSLTFSKVSFKFMIVVIYCFIFNRQLKIDKLEITKNNY